MFKHPRKVTSAVSGEVEGVLGKVFSSGLPYHIGVSAEHLSMVRFKCCEPMWDLLPLGAGWSSQSGLWSGTAYRHALHRILQRVSPFGLRRLFGHWCGVEWKQLVVLLWGRSSAGETSGGDGGVCPSKRWYKAARVLLSSGGLLYKMTWQVVRKSLWLLLSSSMACSSKSCMYLPCSLWSLAAWEIFWASASQMTLEQVASASWSKWLWVVLASLTATK